MTVAPAPERSPPRPPPVELLRFTTCGSVDDGKSTLIGRLLYDAKALMDDQVESLERAAALAGGAPNLANLTDGLRAEREQGITIDVAYRYFTTPRRRFIIADTPGHAQYTRNMVTGASTAGAAIVLVDARAGVLEQSRRHAAIAGLLRIPHLVVAVNKMDLVGWSEARFRAVRAEFEAFLPRLGLRDVHFLPVSALHGDNVVDRSPHAPWYDGPTLLAHLEELHVASDRDLSRFRLPVQGVVRPHRPDDPALHDFRGVSGQIAGGLVRRGDRVLVLPAGVTTRVRRILGADGERDEAFCPQSVVVELEHDVDVARGSLLVAPDARPGGATELRARVCWMHPRPLVPGRRLLLKHTTATMPAAVVAVADRLDLATLEPAPAPGGLALNDLGTVRIRTGRPVFHDGYDENRATGSFILIDPDTHATLAAGLLERPAEPARIETCDYTI